MNKKVFLETMNEAILNDKILHSYLFYGNNIEDFEKEILLFLSEVVVKDMPEDKKNIILNVISKEQIDEFQILDGKEAKVKDIRDFFAKAYEKPLLTNYKVYYIKNADFLNPQSQNAMLKILEEPPMYLKIVLSCHLQNNILDTIKSRCVKMYLDENEGENAKENVEAQILENFKDYLDFLETRRPIKLTKFYGMIAKQINHDNIGLFLNLTEQYINTDIKRYGKLSGIIANARKRLSQNANFDMVKDQLLFKLQEELNEINKS